MNVVNPPVPVKPDDIANKNLTCAICLSVPWVAPVLTPCQHLFCQECISQQAASANGCPTCRTNFQTCYPLDRKGLLYRIWSEIEVKCGNHEEGCNWTGSIASADAHIRSCQVLERKRQKTEVNNRALDDLKYQCACLKASNQMLKQSAEQLRNELAGVVHEKAMLTAELAEATDRNREYMQVVNELQSKINSHDVLPKLFHGVYDFNKFSVLRLARFIARFDERPFNVDINRIYNCVSACYGDLTRGYDLPDYYHMDMRSLLATCAGCTWFTPKQHERIFQWLQEQNWA